MTKVDKPWGHYETLVTGPNYLVKRIIVKPNHRLSLQTHQLRSEHWVIVGGIGHVEINEASYILNPNDAAYIPVGAKHRIANYGMTDLSFIETQVGQCMEEDIQRLEDDYHR